MNLMYISLLLDSLIIIIMIYYVIKGLKAGFAKTITNLFGYLIALTLAFAISTSISATIFDTFVRESVSNFVTEKITTSDQYTMLADQLATALTQLPPILKNNINMDLEGLANSLTNSGSVVAMADAVVDMVFAPMAIMLIRSITFFILFSIFMFIVRRIANALKIANKLPIFGSVNSILGGGLGFLQGGLIVFLL
ncbi:MAG: CvpA family protein, partial [Oscillospiraceae bacterium]